MIIYLRECLKTFRNLQIGGDLLLYHNRLKLLSEIFDNIKVDRTLHLSDTKLSELLKNFGKIKIGADLLLSSNSFNYLQSSFCNTVIMNSALL